MGGKGLGVERGVGVGRRGAGGGVFIFKQPNLSVKINFAPEQRGNNPKAVNDGAKTRGRVRKRFYPTPRGDVGCFRASTEDIPDLPR